MTAAAALTADRLIDAKGQAVTLTRRTSGAYNTATGAAAITTTTQTGKGVILPFATGLRKIAGTNIPATECQCLLSAVGITAPEVDDTLTDAAGTVWSIVEVTTLAPAGEALLHDLTVRASA
jgi:hypothetical protein